MPFGRVNFNSNGNGAQVAAVVALGAWSLVFYARSTPESKVRLINLDRAGQLVPLRTHHRLAKPVQHHSGRLIAVHANNPLKSQCTYTLLPSGDVPRCGEPRP